MRRAAAPGFSLVEVLVSILILSVGVVGAASMQLTVLRNNRLSGFHGIALQLASDIAEQARGFAAPGMSDAGKSFLMLDYSASESGMAPSDTCLGSRSRCDVAGLAESQLHDIQSRVGFLLPHGRVKVCRDATPWDDREMHYRWDCDPDSGNAPIVVKLGWYEAKEDISSDGKKAGNPQLVMLIQP